MKSRYINAQLILPILAAISLICHGCASASRDGMHEAHFRNGAIKSIKPYTDGKLNGIAREYYESGTLKHAIEYQDGKINGMHNTYFPDGAVWKKEIYRDGRFLSQWEYDEEGMLIFGDQ